jgi:hypothetical protein
MLSLFALYAERNSITLCRNYFDRVANSTNINYLAVLVIKSDFTSGINYSGVSAKRPIKAEIQEENNREKMYC